MNKALPDASMSTPLTLDGLNQSQIYLEGIIQFQRHALPMWSFIAIFPTRHIQKKEKYELIAGGIWRIYLLASAGTFFKHNETNSFIGLKKWSSSCTRNKESHDSFKMERIMARSGKEHLIILYPQQEWSTWDQSIRDNLWWIFSRYDKKNSHRVKLCKWRFSFGHLNCSYPQRPYICLHQAKGASVTMVKASTMLAWREIGVKRERGQNRVGVQEHQDKSKFPISKI